MIRRFGESVKNDISYTRRPGVYALLPIRQNLLLTHQNAPEPEFQLPGTPYESLASRSNGGNGMGH